MKRLFILLAFISIFSRLNAQEIPTITTSGEAVVFAAPNEVLMNITLTTEGATIIEAKDKNRKLSKSIINYLKGEKILPQHIQTQYISMSPMRRNHRAIEVDYYRASQSIALCIVDLTKYEAIVDNLLQLGATRLGSPKFKNTEIQKFKAEARNKAILAAKSKAAALAQALGQKIGKAHKINEINKKYYGNTGGDYANNVSDDAANELGENSSFAPGQIAVRATVEVSFVLD